MILSLNIDTILMRHGSFDNFGIWELLDDINYIKSNQNRIEFNRSSYYYIIIFFFSLFFAYLIEIFNM
jgi:hypothetical protein